MPQKLPDYNAVIALIKTILPEAIEVNSDGEYMELDRDSHNELLSLTISFDVEQNDMWIAYFGDDEHDVHFMRTYQHSQFDKTIKDIKEVLINDFEEAFYILNQSK